MVHLDSNLLIEPAAAAAYEAEIKRERDALNLPAPQPPPGSPTPGGRGPEAPKPTPMLGSTATAKRFYGTMVVDPFLATKKFADVVDEVVEQFTTTVGTEVQITVEIQAKSSAGFDENLQRSVKENCGALKFSSFEFETGE
jgi:hypothetical protein